MIMITLTQLASQILQCAAEIQPRTLHGKARAREVPSPCPSHPQLRGADQ